MNSVVGTRYCVKHERAMVTCCGKISQRQAIQAAYKPYGGKKQLLESPVAPIDTTGLWAFKSKSSKAQPGDGNWATF
jgi:hypothetical protein